MSEENKKVVSAFWERFSESRFDAAFELLSEDVLWWVTGSTVVSGKFSKAEFWDVVSGVAESTKNGIQIVPEVLTAEDDRVAMEARSYGEMNEGTVYQNHYHFLHRVIDRKICAVHEYMDTEHVTEIFGTGQN